MSIKNLYQSLIESGKLDADDDQREVVDRFYKLQRRLVEQHTFPARIRRWLPGSKHKAVIKGIYLWGGVGRGKTVLMDLFYSSLQVDTKRRTHFHRMMWDVHRRLGNLNDVKDPLDVVAG
ncbi:MAG: AFG1/ZapE family ATPase, partial [Pseudomonadota bacterium]|nr:AFG1/ZapE family ATPase [Pseudomonadota bacterium]